MNDEDIRRVAVVGAGFMGAQIGLQCAVHGLTVRLVDLSRESLERAHDSIVQELQRRTEAGHISTEEGELIRGRIHSTTELEKGVSHADLVIEAAPEKLEIKREIFGQLDEVCRGRTILATNSSSIPVSRIESATRRLHKVLNMHFYTPVWQIPMVELMGGTRTSGETIEQGLRFARLIGLMPFLCRKESIGFILNRVWRAIKKECFRVVDEGVASHEDLDRAWMIATGMSAGPFGFMDAIGLDVIRDVEMNYYRESGDESDAPPKFLLDMIESGELGVKTGKGFYAYPDPAFENPSWLKGGKT